MAACESVLTTYELLEHIITFLPPRTILAAERVNKTWKNLIDRSKTISRSRCLAPYPTTSHHSYPTYEPNADIRLHPGLGELTYPTSKRAKTSLRNEKSVKDNVFHVDHPQQMARYKQLDDTQYLTSPRIRTLQVLLSFSDSHCLEDCSFKELEAEMGLTVGHLRAAEAEAAAELCLDYGDLCAVMGICHEELEDLDAD